MELVATLFTTLGTAGAGAAAAGGTAAAASGGAGILSTVLGGLRVGTSVISGLSSMAQGRAQQVQDEIDAGNERIAGRAELVQAQEKANAISDQYNQTVADQLAVASASGYDVGSGSVVAARQFAQGQADQQLTIVRNGADMNAALRQSRAFALLAQGQQARDAGNIAGITKIVGGLFDIASIGGPPARAGA